MIDVDKPYPRNVSVLCHACDSVPLCLLPQLIRLFQIIGCKGLIHIRVHRAVGIRRILCRIRPFNGVINVVKFHRSMGSPAPDQRIRKGTVIRRIPAHALKAAGYSQFPELICEIRGKGLAYRIPGRIEQVQFCFYSIFLPDAVVPHGPARLVEQRRRSLRIILHL